MRGEELLFRSAEAAFRDALRAELVARPMTVRAIDGHGLSLHLEGAVVPHSGGMVKFRDLIARPGYSTRFGTTERYEREVTAPVRELRLGLNELGSFMYACRLERPDRSDKHDGGSIMAGVRHISEALGEGDEPYPSIRLWDESKRLVTEAEAIARQAPGIALMTFVARARPRHRAGAALPAAG